LGFEPTGERSGSSRYALQHNSGTIKKNKKGKEMNKNQIKAAKEWKTRTKVAKEQRASIWRIDNPLGKYFHIEKKRWIRVDPFDWTWLQHEACWYHNTQPMIKRYIAKDRRVEVCSVAGAIDRGWIINSPYTGSKKRKTEVKDEDYGVRGVHSNRRG